MKNNSKLYFAVFFLLLILVTGSFASISSKKTTQNLVEYYMVMIPDDESIAPPKDSVLIQGCGKEYLVKVTSSKGTTGGLVESLEELLSINSTDYDETDYINSLALSDGKVTITNQSNLTVIDVQGKLISAGTCDDPRVMAQLEETVKLYMLDKPYEIRLNGSNTNWRCFGDMSGECN